MKTLTIRKTSHEKKILDNLNTAVLLFDKVSRPVRLYTFFLNSSGRFSCQSCRA